MFILRRKIDGTISCLQVTWPKKSVYTCSLLRNEHRCLLLPDHVTINYSSHSLPSFVGWKWRCLPKKNRAQGSWGISSPLLGWTHPLALSEATCGMGRGWRARSRSPLSALGRHFISLHLGCHPIPSFIHSFWTRRV